MLRAVVSAALLGGALLAGAPAAAQEPVTIGLVVPGGGEAGGLAEEVREAAEAAIADANRDGGYRGRPFALRVVNEDGLWGQGLGRVVALAFDDPVRGVIGGLDGRSAHLIQQVIIKARIPFLTPWASDPTLSRGMIPWFFQVVPDDRRQAAAVVMDPGSLVVVADTSYDDRHFADAVMAAADSGGVAARRVGAAAVAGMDDLSGLMAGPREGEDVRVVLAVDESEAVRILDRLSTLPRPPTVCLPLRLARAAVAGAAARYPGRVLVPTVAPGAASGGTNGEPGAAPAAPAARFTREAVVALVAAIRSAGLDHWAIRDALADASLRGGEGPVFDEAGRRPGPVRLAELVSPVPAPER